jgi:hypothetical protein
MIAATPPPQYDVGPIESVPIVKPAGAETEIPPWTLDSRTKFLTTAWTFRCPTTDTLLMARVTCNGGGRMTAPNTFGTSPEVLGDEGPWRRNYHGVFSAHRIGGRLLTINHGENKNERIGDRLYQNTVVPEVRAEECADGVVEGYHRTCWPAYSGFVTASRRSRSGRLTDLGPIIWPEQGYRDRQEPQLAVGVRHPHSIIVGDYVYVYYLDSGPQTAGIKVARSPLTRLGSPGSWRVLDRRKHWVPALPDGFTRSRTSKFYDSPGPTGRRLFGGYEGSVSFAVAKLRNEPRYVGVEEYHEPEGGPFHVALRFSRDLIHWGPRSVLEGIRSSIYLEFKMHYAIPLDRTGRLDTRVDRRRFYLVGTGSRGDVHRVALSAEHLTALDQ